MTTESFNDRHSTIGMKFINDPDKENEYSHVELSAEAQSFSQFTDSEKRRIMYVRFLDHDLRAWQVQDANNENSRRIDMRLLPILGAMYSISLIDRTNLGLALVAGMQEELDLAVGNRYTVIVMLFFISYM